MLHTLETFHKTKHKKKENYTRNIQVTFFCLHLKQWFCLFSAFTMICNFSQLSSNISNVFFTLCNFSLMFRWFVCVCVLLFVTFLMVNLQLVFNFLFFFIYSNFFSSKFVESFFHKSAIVIFILLLFNKVGVIFHFFFC